MKILGQTEIRTLIEKKSAQCISIYMPVRGLGDPQDIIRCKNLLTEAERLLTERGMRSPEAADLMAPEYDLLKVTDFWMNLRADGLAFYVSKDFRERFVLPRKFTEAVTVSTQFRVKPLIPLITGDGRYFVLALSKDNTRLFLGSRFGITDVGLPESTLNRLEAALQYDAPPSQLPHHAGTALAGGRRSEAMVHGHGVVMAEEKTNSSHFFHLLAQGLSPIFHEQKIPVVLAGAESLAPVYRELDTSGMVVPDSLSGNPESMSSSEFHRKSWELVAPLFTQEETLARKKFAELHGTGKALKNIAAILQAAIGGRVETLFISEHKDKWGVLDPVKHQVEFTGEDFPGAIDVLDLTVAITLGSSGKVYVKKKEEMPAETCAAAVLRF